MAALRMGAPSSAAPLFAEPQVSIERRADGSIVLTNPVPLGPVDRAVGVWLERWARERGETVFLAERPSPGATWRRLTYAAALDAVRRVATALLQRGLGPQRPVAILSDNGIDHAILALAAMHAGIPVATISPAYSLMSSDHAKLRDMIGLVEPGLIHVSDEGVYGPALAAIAGCHDAEIVASSTASGATRFATLTDTLVDELAVRSAFAAIGPDTVARYLFTSGSTGAPKAVVNTQRMLCTSQEAKALVWPFLAAEPLVLVDWLPWSHTFGANHNFNMVLRNGGTLYIDGGKPAPHLFQLTVENIREIGPDVCFNVPRGFDMLIAALRRDDGFRERFFASVRLIFYAGAALPQNLWHALQDLSQQTIGRTIPMVSAWGTTETAPLATDCHFQAERSGNIGVPVPGVALKLVPSGDKTEIRVRGPSVTPGYFRNEAETARAFDEEGFYRPGDAVRFVDPDRPEKGLVFDGRVAEDFKLSSGTWVSVGALRVEAIAALDPVAQDIVVTGHDRDEVCFLVFPNLIACRALAGLGDEALPEEVVAHPNVVGRLREGLQALKARSGGSSRHATRARLLSTMPQVDRGEITDKGYVNQRAVLVNRDEDVARLHGDDAADYVAIDALNS